LHAYFLKLGDPKVPVVYEVDRIRDGRSFTTRRVVAIQHGTAIFNMAASFQVDESGPRPPRRDARGRRRREPRVDLGTAFDGDEPEPIDRQGAPHVVDAFDMRNVACSHRRAATAATRRRDPDQDTWFRTRGALPDDPLLHTCIVAYASDLTLLAPRSCRTR